MKDICHVLIICLLSSVLYANSENEETSIDTIFSESQFIQPEYRTKRGHKTKQQNRRRIRNVPNDPTDVLAQATVINPTATIKTLQIENITVFPFAPETYFPIGLSAPSFNPAETPSEAFGYAIRNAVEYDDPEFFRNLVNGFLYFANRTEIQRKEFNGANSNLAWGLMGFSPNYKTGSYSSLSNLSSASDADEDVLRGLIKAYGFIYGPNPKSNWQNILQNKLFQDNINPPTTGPCMENPNQTCQLVFKSVDLKTMIQMMGESFAFKDSSLGDPLGFRDLGKPNSGNYPQPAKYMLSLDNYGHDPVNPDYFDPQMFISLMNFFGKGTPQYDNLLKAGQNTMDAIAGLAAQYNNWIPDNAFQQGNAGNFGFDAVRILMRLGQYIASSNNDLLNRRDVATKVLKALVQNISSNIFSNQTGLKDQAARFAQGAHGGGLQGGAFTGPWLLALKALKKVGQLPQNIKNYNQQNNTNYIANVTDAFRFDLTQYDISSADAWQHNGYFNIQLALLCQGIMNDLGL